MKLLLSVNNKFYKNFDYNWINLFFSYDIYNIIDGCEFALLFNNEYENKYILDLVSDEMYNKKWIFQFHAPCLSTYFSLHNSYLPMLQYYHNVSQFLGYPTKVNFHPIESTISMDDSINKTKEEFYKLLDLVAMHSFNIDVLVENLNQLPNVYRANLDDLDEVIKISKLGFTYDIGHMTVDNKYEYCLTEDHIKNLRNIHLHDTDEIEHFPYYNNKLFLEDFFEYTKKIGYNDTIVAEIALDYMKSEGFERKILEYTRNMHILNYYRKMKPQKNT